MGYLIGAPKAGSRKEPWEMTKEEFIANPPEEVDIWLMENKPPHRGKIGAIPDFFGGPPTKGYRVANTVTPFEIAHKNIVKYAFKEGKPVPPKVLADYPYLVKKANPSEAVKVPEGIRVIDFPKYLRPALSSELGKDVKFKIWDRIGGYLDQITNTIYYPKGDKETLIHELMHLIEHSPAIDGLTKSLIKAGYYKKGEIGKMLQWYLTSEDGFALANTEPKAWLIINNFLKRYSPTEVLRKNSQELKGLRELVGTEIAPKVKEPWEMTREELEADPRFVITDQINLEAKVLLSGKIALHPTKFFEHSEGGREEILRHELGHLKVRSTFKDKGKEFWRISDSGLFGKYDKEKKEWIPIKGFYSENLDETLANAISMYEIDPAGFTKRFPQQTPIVKALSEGKPITAEIAPKAEGKGYLV